MSRNFNNNSRNSYRSSTAPDRYYTKSRDNYSRHSSRMDQIKRDEQYNGKFGRHHYSSSKTQSGNIVTMPSIAPVKPTTTALVAPVKAIVKDTPPAKDNRHKRKDSSRKRKWMSRDAVSSSESGSASSSDTPHEEPPSHKRTRRGRKRSRTTDAKVSHTKPVSTIEGRKSVSKEKSVVVASETPVPYTGASLSTMDPLPSVYDPLALEKLTTPDIQKRVLSVNNHIAQSTSSAYSATQYHDSVVTIVNNNGSLPRKAPFTEPSRTDSLVKSSHTSPKQDGVGIVMAPLSDPMTYEELQLHDSSDELPDCRQVVIDTVAVGPPTHHGVLMCSTPVREPGAFDLRTLLSASKSVEPPTATVPDAPLLDLSYDRHGKPVSMMYQGTRCKVNTFRVDTTTWIASLTAPNHGRLHVLVQRPIDGEPPQLTDITEAKDMMHAWDSAPLIEPNYDVVRIENNGDRVFLHTDWGVLPTRSITLIQEAPVRKLFASLDPYRNKVSCIATFIDGHWRIEVKNVLRNGADRQ